MDVVLLHSDTATVTLNITGEKVALGPFSREILPQYERWLNDIDVTINFVNGPIVPADTENAEQQHKRRGQDEHSVAFAVYERATMRPIGTTSLYNVDYFNRRAAFSILIGEKDCWDRGFGTEATILTLDYGFNILGLNTILLTVFSFNHRGIRAYERAGFRVIGRWRQAKRLGERVYDVVYMDCLAAEFQHSTLRNRLPAP